jgi:hypothetical protein
MAMAWQDNLDFHFLATGNGRIEVVDLKPQKHAVSVWLGIWVPDGAVMVLYLPPVQLQNRPAVRDQPFILSTAMRALTTQETLIPATARLDITHANERLWMRTNSVA